MKRKVIYFCLSIVCICACKHSNPQRFPVQEVAGKTYKGMIVSAHPEATLVGYEILQKGGNAVDVAVAVQYALAVVFPVAGNLGGGGFMVYRGNDGKVFTLDYREKAPALAFRDMYLDSLKNVIPDLSLNGHLAAGVPGAVAGFFTSHEKLGKLPMSVLIEPAIRLAEKGFPLTTKDAEMLNLQRDLFKRVNTAPNAFTQKDTFIRGETFIQPDLAQTLREIRDRGKAGFYEGKTAGLIIEEMKRGKGIITHQDLKNYKAIWRTPLTGKYKQYEIISMGPPSSGGLALLQLLNAVAPYPTNPEELHQAARTHLVVEAEKRVYADRAKHLGDPDFYPVPVKGLIAEEYMKSRMSTFKPEKSTPSKEIFAGNPTPNEKLETTHLSVIDREGNAVAVTTTLNGGFGSSVVVGKAGFLLNNEMDDFSIKPGVPNYYGLVGAEANAVQPDKRMLSSMTPTIITESGKLKMVVGTPGGSTIITSVFQTIQNVLEHGLSIQEAVALPRYHHQWLPDKIMYEKDCFTPTVIHELQTKGHQLEARKGTSGRVDAIVVKPDGSLEGGADPRGDDCWLGIE